MLDRVAGNAAAIQGLKAALQAGRLSHSVLLCAEPGAGAGFAARCLAADYLYPAGGPAAEAVLAGGAPECLTVRGEGASGEIKIDRVRAVRREVYNTALSAQGRAVLVYGAQKMNASSANALLKVLEEPPQGVLFVLTASSAAAVLPTIRSRCVVLALAPVPPAECEAYLKKHRPDCKDAALLSRVYGGRIGSALAAADSPARRAVLDAALEGAEAIAQKDGYRLMALLAPFEKDKPGAADFFCDLQGVCALALRGAAPRPLPPAQAALALEKLEQARRQLAGNVSPKLAFACLAAALGR